MIICLDVGNSHIFGGIFENDRIITRFRHLTNNGSTSDQLGVFLKNLLRESDIDFRKIKNVAIGSVVPSIDYTLRAACKKYFNIDPFVLRAGVKTGIKLRTQNQNETGADLIAGCIAASHFHPNRNIIIIDLGTATTFTALSSNKEFLGVSILPGLRISMEALENNTAKLFPVEIQKPEKITGRTTTEAIQSGLYYGHLGAIKEIIRGITQEAFAGTSPLIIGTGGFVHLFEQEKMHQTQTSVPSMTQIDPSSLEIPQGLPATSKRSVHVVHEHCEQWRNAAEDQNATGIFNAIEPDLVLHGLRIALELNVK